MATMAFLVWGLFIFGVFTETAASEVVLLTGGYLENGLSSNTHSVEVFDPLEDGSCSKDLADIPDERAQHTTNFLNGEVIMCGGKYSEDSCLSLDQDKNFVHHSQLSLSFDDDAGAVVGDTILLVGFMGEQLWNGSQWIIPESNFGEFIDPGWASCMAVTSDNTVLMAGGSRQGNQLLKYKNGVWERMEEDYPGPTRTGQGCAFIQMPEGDAFLMAGGLDIPGYSRLHSSFLYNIEKGQWEEVGKLGVARSGGKILVVDGRVLILGGWIEEGRQTEVEEFNLESKTWTTIQQKIKEKRSCFGAVVVPGSFVGC